MTTPDAPATHLLIINAHEPLAWVLENQRMAFPTGRTQQSFSLRKGDEILLYTTRGCFGNPTRDLGRVIGLAIIISKVRTLDTPVVFRSAVSPKGAGCASTASRPSVRASSCAISSTTSRSSPTPLTGASACAGPRSSCRTPTRP